MTQTIKLFLPNDFFDELLYQYEDKDSDLRKLVAGFLKPLGKQGKMAMLNQMIQARVMKNGKMAMEEKDLKKVDLDENAVQSDDAWIPEKVTADEVKTYTLVISDRLHKDLVSFGKVFCARLKIYNDTLDSNSPEYENQVAKFPKCFEQIIQDNVVGALSNAIAENIDKEYDEEFNELEKGIEAAKPKESPKR